MGRVCCGNPELSVMIGGDITGLNIHEVEKYVKEMTKFNFLHVVKEEAKGFGFVHFKTRHQASLFYHQTRNKSYQYDNNRGPFKFYGAKYFNTDRKVDYTLDKEAGRNDENKLKKRKVIEIVDDNPSSEENAKSLNNVAYGLYENDSYYILIMNIPGIKNKSDLVVSSINDKLIIINGSFNEKVAGKAIKSTLPIGPFEVQVELPNKIETISAKIEIEHGVCSITLKKSNTRKIIEII